MNEISIKRLSNKYGTQNIKGKKYQKIIKDIIFYNKTKINESVSLLTDNKIKKQLESFKNKVKFPEIKNIISKPQFELLKAAEKGKFITQTLRDQLTDNLKSVLKKAPVGSKLNQSLIKELKTNIKKTFENYTKRDPRYGIPSNIRNISVTEMKSAVNMIRKSYMDELINRNPNMYYKKEWRHYKTYSKEYRRGHAEKNGEVKEMNEPFLINEYKKIKGKWTKTGNIIKMDRPHDEKAGPSMTIGCSCELKYKIYFRRK